MKLLSILKPFIWAMTGCPMRLAVVSAIVGGNAASDAADAQVKASHEANQVARENMDKQLAFSREALNKSIDFQNRSYDKQLALQQPYRDIGLRSQNKLQSLMGLGGLGAQEGYRFQDYAANDKNAQAASKLQAQINALKAVQAPAAFQAGDRNAQIAQNPWWFDQSGGKAELAAWDAKQAKGAADYAAGKAKYDAAQKQLAGLQRQYGKANAAAQAGYKSWLGKQKLPSDYGSLMKDFTGADFQKDGGYKLAGVPHDLPVDYKGLTKGFTAADFHADPGYAWRKQQGEQGLDRAAAASGRVGSGRYLKDAMTFNQGLADQTYNDAFNRFQTDRGNRISAIGAIKGLADQTYNDAYNRFQVNRGNKLNALQSLGGVGQTSANTLTSGAMNQGNQGQGAWQNYGNSANNAVGNYGQYANDNIIGAGNARASGYMGGANAVMGGINNALQFGGMLLGKKGF